ncbi:MAG: L-threonylcarbamoyladenylate synthase [Acetivibrionales bacterium]|jgi:L-threonylcarbamoyladenylate synthase|nr:threonylcarbamoyl-AMP synthase [Clostridiaceae bacterium]
MNTIIINGADDEAFLDAAKALREGNLVAFPTETVYGLGANALSTDAVKKIYEAKGRPSDNPLIVHISEVSELNKLVMEIPEAARLLIKAFWPGPLTMVFRKSNLVPDIITAGLETVAVRMPDSPIAQRLIKEAGVPVAAPSANLSGRPSPTTYKHVMDDLYGRIDYIIDGGPCQVGVESTVLDVTTDIPIILRPGGITLEMLESVLGKVNTDSVLEIKGNIKPRSPGMKYRHYSPKAEMVLISGKADAVAEKINKLISESRKQGLRVGVLTSIENANKYDADVIVKAGSVKHAEQIAAGLYDSLRTFDEEKVDIIYSETFEEKGIGRAIMNRLKKASSGKIIELKGDN